jgi:hypothetical protein
MAKIRSKLNAPNASYFSLKVEFQTSPNKKRVESARASVIVTILTRCLRFGRSRPPIFMGCHAEPPCAM